jgi:hypothetical protein
VTTERVITIETKQKSVGGRHDYFELLFMIFTLRQWLIEQPPELTFTEMLRWIDEQLDQLGISISEEMVSMDVA